MPVDVLREVAQAIEAADNGTWSDCTNEAEAAVVTLYRLLLTWADHAHAVGSVERGTLWAALRNFATDHGLLPIVQPILHEADDRYLDELLARSK